MKYTKMLGLLAVAAAALMAFVGTASATVTSPPGTAYNGPLVATSSNTSLDGTVDIACASSTVAGTVENGNTEGAITTLDFAECGKDTVSVLANGSLTVKENKVYSKGARVTVQLHRTVLGFPVTTHCIYATPITKLEVGELKSATDILLSGTNIPQESTDGACGSSAQWTGTYTITTPAAGVTVD